MRWISNDSMQTSHALARRPRSRPLEPPVVERRGAPAPPPTRFQGSKYKLLDWIWNSLRSFDFTTVLDAFGGSGCVSHFLKGKDKAVTYNDVMKSFCLSAVALVENDAERLPLEALNDLQRRHDGLAYQNFIERTFPDIYFLDHEDEWLDRVAQNIPRMLSGKRQAIAYYALFQAAIAKRPYNLFHRKNLYMRVADVKRGFGNKTSWDRPFAEHMASHVEAANRSVFQGRFPCRVLNQDALDVPGGYDLVYIDPPYLNRHGVGVDYYGFYHFLEGLASYEEWRERVDFASKHRRLKPRANVWSNPRTILEALETLFRIHGDSLLVVSYRSDGIPSAGEIERVLRSVKRRVDVRRLEQSYKYVLSTNTDSTEMLFIGS